MPKYQKLLNNINNPEIRELADLFDKSGIRISWWDYYNDCPNRNYGTELIKAAETVYNAKFRKQQDVRETDEYKKLVRVCRIFEIALNNALGIDHAYTDAYKEAEKELEEREKNGAI